MSRQRWWVSGVFALACAQGASAQLEAEAQEAPRAAAPAVVESGSLVRVEEARSQALTAVLAESADGEAAEPVFAGTSTLMLLAIAVLASVAVQRRVDSDAGEGGENGLD